MTKKIGFIGVGNMGGAIIKGLSALDGVEVHGTDLDKARLEMLSKDCGMVAQPGAEALAAACDYVVLAVKPQHARPVLDSLSGVLDGGKCLLSIAAGLTSETLREYIGGKCPVVRIMPNTPALVGKGVYAICLEDEKLSSEQKSFVPEAFKSIGQVHILSEKLFDAFTAVVGSGPAYVMYFMEALVESAVYLGIPRPQATDMVLALFDGSVSMAAESDEHISVLREMVSSPAGSTIRALAHMDRTATRGNILDAIVEAYERNIELGQK
ncbi:pyrroline-5-carboxylate reductase [Salidesulfovibrio onnuriiensis]|uniref:pyrroline-5-carboxylate reductase n=1 Tax=Salidesulfovibrio onnuriiensis TaxID=2583823 RepID=UPI0011CA27BF|nr:pyrroline-5-carboxylate reductase [Salidesulfovibrio onnuriiensis]